MTTMMMMIMLIVISCLEAASSVYRREIIPTLATSRINIYSVHGICTKERETHHWILHSVDLWLWPPLCLPQLSLCLCFCCPVQLHLSTPVNHFYRKWSTLQRNAWNVWWWAAVHKGHLMLTIDCLCLAMLCIRDIYIAPFKRKSANLGWTRRF